ncbi:hypothetical protein [Streptomyces sp. NBC_01443]|uniref:hypothetical protein n=1 Tax=Streptomyces sp. NBC_01443 TaxID=2903868 RepID=UPI002259C087|nr:hypothetical protein [Streptomyces sp. NBC_01443]MCX4631683.1 hypothetical protein [Streptomyces sp. NBC_01443]
MNARNSEALDVLLRVAADSRVSWRAVQLAGGGISAEAAGVMWMLSDGKKALGAEELSGLLMDQIDLVDELTGIWRAFDSGETSLADFEARLEVVISGFEAWLDRALSK